FAILRPASAPTERAASFVLSLEKETGADLGIFNPVPLPSPDGRQLVFVSSGENGRRLLNIRPLDSTETRPLAGTDGAAAPMWSPDGRWIGFHADGKLKKVSPSGGSPQTMAEVPVVQEAAWGSNGDIIYRPTNRAPLFLIRESGGAPKPLTQLDRPRAENSHRGLSFLPDGRRFLF